MQIQINSVKPLLSFDTTILQLDVSNLSRHNLETIVSDFKAGLYEIKKVRKKRSISANSYLWVLCDEIAEKIGSTKEEVYRRAVADKGVFSTLEFKSKEAMQDFKRHWTTNGVGWLTKTLSDKQLHAYYGTSVYDSKEMSVIIEWLIDEAERLGIPTMNDDELKKMTGRWGDCKVGG